ncbi:TetR/AcrR family transcriptional regulator [Vreelandella titanicae]|uniref:TetR/AcrR family transcriptional regulator n=1 Tax=Halomonadaceae TaxID=28256 RepID=UPI0014874F21|nr:MULTISPECIES: TetR/AcrR family transcriptional regulator [Halomonas]
MVQFNWKQSVSDKILIGGESMRIPRGEGRERLLSAATKLFLENGYDATSPQAIYAESGVGQGSFYHHFPSKDALMHVVLLQLVASETNRLHEINEKSSNPMNRLDLYLKITRVGTKGCKFGRFVYEASVQKSEMAEPIKSYFSALLKFLEENLSEAIQQERIDRQIEAKVLAQTIVSQIQGGYILSRVYQDDSFLERNLAYVRQLIGLKPEPSAVN